MEVSLLGSVHGNDTIRDSFQVVITQHTYFLIVYIFYGIPSLAVTVKIVCGILDPRNKEFFRTPFFVLFTHDCITNVMFFLLDVLAVRIPLSGLITGWMTTLPVGPYITVIYVVSFHSLYMTFYSAVFLSLGRAIVICLPTKGNQMLKELLPIFVLTIYLLPISTTWFLYPVVAYMRVGGLPGYGLAFDYKKVFPQ
ncbi:hypothetical protein OSTOST_05602, partial [Ostertagia ostertagi]